MKRINLSQGKYALVDDEDFERVSRYKWQAGKNFHVWYAQTTINKRTVHMHRFILNPLRSQFIDHKNHNGLDNRKKNLRACALWQNHANRRKQKNTSSRFKGVYWNKTYKVWIAAIKKNRIPEHLGNFSDEIKAAIAYNKAAKKLFGEFAHLNVIPSRNVS